MDSSGTLDLLKIDAYQDAARSQSLGTFTALVNPQSVSVFTRNRYGKQFPLSSASMLSAFSSGGPNYMKATLILDGSGLLAQQSQSDAGVVEQLTQLMNATMNYVGNIHQPPYLKVIWGKMPIFYGRAEQCDVHYRTFTDKGIPIRADVDLVLLEDVNTEYDKRVANPSSPDLFHLHNVSDKDTLPYISYRYYGSTGFGKQIARANGLNNLYNLQAGVTLLIPPLDEVNAS
ncbi:hypothetical protein PRUB_a0084 [Pseudoalteromonas rubra]|uniref:LysM domain-containing protein n=1 Tax=Pseudoalteromonas rubra TaxID=43658 RepID=A0A8T0C4V9_9GAMM|nr:LysM domain-containing protein [Pseudoalteromonas rubra]KAF7785719.1 hypothetical protein PRUB_a0084 [Pseudoalteromonas rubra]